MLQTGAGQLRLWVRAQALTTVPRGLHRGTLAGTYVEHVVVCSSGEALEFDVARHVMPCCGVTGAFGIDIVGGTV